MGCEHHWHFDYPIGQARIVRCVNALEKAHREGLDKVAKIMEVQAGVRSTRRRSRYDLTKYKLYGSVCGCVNPANGS